MTELTLIGDRGRRYALRDGHPVAFGRVSVILLATDDQGVEVCIKEFREILQEGRPDGQSAFLREMTAARLLSHPNIAPVIDMGIDEERNVPYIVLPYFRAGSLRDLLRTRDFIPVSSAMALLTGVASAVDFAHSKGVIHGDIKPENILLHDDQTNALLADFGTAKFSRFSEPVYTSELAPHLLGGGTTAYLSPEQVYDGTQAARSDIYSFAMVAYEALTGRLPINTSIPPFQQMSEKVAGNSIPAREVNPALTETIERALAAGLRREPSERPDTAGDLCRMLAGEIEAPVFRRPSLVRPQPGSGWRAWPPAQQAAVATAALAALGGAVAAVIKVLPDVLGFFTGGG